MLDRGLLGRTRARTAKPAPTRARTTAEPTKPDAPVTNATSLLDKAATNSPEWVRSAAPMRDEMSGFRQDRRPTSEGLECVDRVAAERTQLLAGASDAEQGDESRLASACILAGGLADVLRAAFRVQEVIANLEGEPDGACIGPQRFALGRRGTAQDCSCIDGEL